MIHFFYSDRAVPLFWTLVILTLVVILGMQLSGAPLKTEAAPGGIVSFELVGTFEGSQQIINSWQGSTMLYAGINMGLDFLFITLYSITIAWGCGLISARLPASWSFFKSAGTWLGYGVLLAALLDIIENISLIKILQGSQSHLLPQLANWCATPKFILVFLALLYLLIGVYPVLQQARQLNK